MNVRNLSFLLVFLCTSLLSACASNSIPEQMRYYVLESSPSSPVAVAPKQTARQVKLMPVTVPDYLKQANLVMKLSNHEISIANQHLWAEDLRQSIEQVLLNQLNQRFADILFTEQCAKCARLSIDIQHFYPTVNGKVYLSGFYEMRALDKTTIRHAFSFSTQLENGGYIESVAAMRELLQQLGAAIELE